VRGSLSGHDGRSGLVLRKLELSETASRPGSEVSDVVRDLHQADGNGVEGTRGLDNGVVSGEGLELLINSAGCGVGDRLTLFGAVTNS